ncbi:MAG TPA: ABC transporter permease [Roseiflexaceae bacterium]|nr:ABC transporter permease [Roseiflexaceae bacterium]
MTTITQPTALDQSARRQRSLWGDAWRRLISSASGRAGLAISSLLVLLAILVPVAWPYDASRDRNLRDRLKPPSAQYVFGTDELGRDIFRRVLHGARISISVGFFAVSLAVVLGSVLGLVAGFAGGWFDMVAVWLMDLMLAFPSTLLAIAIVSVLGTDLQNTMLAVSIVEIPIFGRIARSAVLSARNQEYITAAHTTGISQMRILFRHILPNCITPMMVQATLAIATAIISAAALGFLGLGVQPPKPEWGTMLSAARDYVGQGKWWYSTFPGLAIMLTVLGFNLLGDGLRDALDPRLRK